MADEKRRLEVVSLDDNEDEGVRTFVLHNEDHTLGNALRYIIMKNPEVEFCGYSVPHPSESKINFRIQTKGPPATEVLQKGLSQLSAVTQHVQNVFEASVYNFKQNPPKDEDLSMDTSSS